MKNKKNKLIKLATMSVLVLSTMISALMPTTVYAVTVTGNAVFTIDNDAVTASIPAPNTNYSFARHWGAAHNTVAINGSTLGFTPISPTGSFAVLFPVNTNSTLITHAAVDRRENPTTMDSSNTLVGQIGLSGAFIAGGDTGIITPYDMYMKKNLSNVWEVITTGAGFSDASLFTLANVSETVNANGELLLSGDLHWSNIGFSWALLTAGDISVKLGAFSLAPSAVPVPAAVWLFATGLLGLIAKGKKTVRTV